MYRVFMLYVIVAGSNTIWSNAAIISSNDECVRLEDCPQVLDLIKSKRHHFGTRNLLRILHCENQGRQAYLKCVSASKINEFMDKADLLPSEENCGLDELRSKISGGETAELDEYPWIALLRYRNAAGNMSYGCHANVISKKYLITAAHCIDRGSSSALKARLVGDAYSVILGEYDIRNKTDCIIYPYGSDCNEEVKEYLIESHKIHPDYDSRTKVNDIALIRLQSEAEFSDYIKPICLPPNSLILNRSDTWWIGGWGETEKYKMNNVKQKARFAYKTEDECFVNINLTETQICAGSHGTAKTCPGDSGGPLMMQSKIGDNFRTFLIGVTSLGTDCNRDVQITIFTKTSAFIEWIITSLEK